MKVYNLFGGPGCGKSTLAARMFAKMKQLGIDCELVTEAAKDIVWEGGVLDQYGLFAEQLRRVKRLEGKVDIAITDSPILLQAV